MMSIFLNGNFYLSRILQLAKMQKVEPKRGAMGWVGEIYLRVKGWNEDNGEGIEKKK